MLGIWNKVVWLNERFPSMQSMVRLYMEFPDLVGFAYVNNIYFPLIFHEYLYLLSFSFYCFSIISIIMVI